MDIPLTGRRYTWKKENSKSKLDSILCETDWLIEFPSLSLVVISSVNFDHTTPLILGLEYVTNCGLSLLDALMNGFPALVSNKN